MAVNCHCTQQIVKETVQLSNSLKWQPDDFQILVHILSSCTHTHTHTRKHFSRVPCVVECSKVDPSVTDGRPGSVLCHTNCSVFLSGRGDRLTHGFLKCKSCRPCLMLEKSSSRRLVGGKEHKSLKCSFRMLHFYKVHKTQRVARPNLYYGINRTIKPA